MLECNLRKGLMLPLLFHHPMPSDTADVTGLTVCSQKSWDSLGRHYPWAAVRGRGSPEVTQELKQWSGVKL